MSVLNRISSYIMVNMELRKDWEALQDMVAKGACPYTTTVCIIPIYSLLVHRHRETSRGLCVLIRSRGCHEGLRENDEWEGKG
jgi:hypothetical protein